MRKSLFLAGLATLAVGTFALATPESGVAEPPRHCDESCKEGSCQPDYSSFTVCIGGGSWIPCEMGSCL
jgi:hypothetical protein